MAVLTDEQAMLKDAALSWGRSRAPISSYRALRDSKSKVGFDREIYAEMAEMGWPGIVAPEEYGGSDFGLFGLGVVLEQCGRTLVSSPLALSAAGGVTALVTAGDGAQKERWLEALVSGSAVATIACDEGARHNPAHCSTRAEYRDGEWRLSGQKRPVLFGMAADVAIVSARTSSVSEELTLFLVDTQTPSLTRSALSEIDVRGAAVFDFADVTLSDGDVLGEVGEGFELLDRILDPVRAATASEMLGAATQAFETTLDYLRTREQFGRIIGSFQALQHRAAAMFAELELTRSAVEAALQAIDNADPKAAELVSVAKALVGDTFRLVAGEMIQMHGGIGMTDEHDAGLYFKRALAFDSAFGAAGFHRERYGRLTGY